MGGQANGQFMQQQLSGWEDEGWEDEGQAYVRDCTPAPPAPTPLAAQRSSSPLLRTMEAMRAWA